MTSSPLDHSSFPTTQWSQIVACARPDGEGFIGAMEQLVERYRLPILVYLRAYYRCSLDEAEDLSQSFILQLLQCGVGSADAETGRFRAWLRGALRHFVQNHRRKQRARKRGGDRPGAALDRMAGQLPDARAAGPEELFDAAYKQELLARAVQAMFADYEAENRECYARVFREYYLLADGPAVPTYRQVANKLGVSEHDVTNWLAHGRARLRQKVIELVRNSVTDERGLSLELAHLRGEEP